MLQGTGSNVGKSLLVAGFCRLFCNRGLRTRPFKPQNMSNNAAVTADGGEIGRAQALQAKAAGVPPSVHMNPVLLKPQTEIGAQVVVQGKLFGACKARDYHALKPKLMPHVLDSYARLAAEADLVLVEGAGSPAEVNLRSGDIANMGFAEAADLPVVLVGDIDRGGVIASLVGTHMLLEQAEQARLSGYIVNKFRGDPSLFDDAHGIIEARTSMRTLGVLPWFDDAARLPAEDSLDLEDRTAGPRDAVKVVVPRWPRLSNFDDLDPLAAEPDVNVVFVRPGEPLPGDADLVILPGSKATLADLAAFRGHGWDVDLHAHIRRGGLVLGLCGGFQMLGKTIADPDGIEGEPATADGLGWLDMHTILTGEKKLVAVEGIECRSGLGVSGYEMHVGKTEGAALARPFLDLDGVPEGAMSEEGRIIGCYVHGLFASDAFRSDFLNRIRHRQTSAIAYERQVDQTLDRLADHLERHLDIDGITEIAGLNDSR
ncbi:MAG: cobyric acid synthase [Alphaproteobacteria bacterium]|nr:cobyric acid synthase [Alphaproteobacteria bacterium]